MLADQEKKRLEELRGAAIDAVVAYLGALCTSRVAMDDAPLYLAREKTRICLQSRAAFEALDLLLD